MTKNELVQEYLSLEGKVEQLTEQLLLARSGEGRSELQGEVSSVVKQFEFITHIKTFLQVERLRAENERLRCENAELKSKVLGSCSSDSADSETDSSDSCSTSSTSSMSPGPVDYAQTNGRSPTALQEAV